MIIRLKRFLKARNWNLDESEQMLKKAVEWRRENDVMNAECTYCHKKPGFHSIVSFMVEHLFKERVLIGSVKRTLE